MKLTEAAILERIDTFARKHGIHTSGRDELLELIEIKRRLYSQQVEDLKVKHEERYKERNEALKFLRDLLEQRRAGFIDSLGWVRIADFLKRFEP